MNSVLFLTVTLVAFAFAACSSNTEQPPNPYPHGHQSQYPACDAIIKQCHPLDVGEGPIHDCHDLGDCISKKDDCLLRICIANSDAGATDATRE